MATRNKEQHAAYMRLYYKTNDRAYLYSRWLTMLRRCYSPLAKSYAIYGGRGILVCDEWKQNKEAFIDWALSSGWTRGVQLDRIDSNGPYSPENCRWVTSRQNNRNRRNNKLNEQKVAEIRVLCGQGISDAIIARQFSVDRALIYRIRKNIQWV